MSINQAATEILNTVFDNGRIETNADENLEGFLAEVEVEVDFEATEQGFEGDEKQAIVDFALSHVG